MLKETETEETIVFLVTFLSLVAFQLGGGPPAPLLAMPMASGTTEIIRKLFCRKPLISSS